MYCLCLLYNVTYKETHCLEMVVNNECASLSELVSSNTHMFAYSGFHLRGNLAPPSTTSPWIFLCVTVGLHVHAPSLAGHMFGGLREHLVTLGRFPWPLPKSWQGQSNCSTSQNVILSCDKAYVMYWTMAARAIDKYCWICSWLLTVVTSLRYTEL